MRPFHKVNLPLLAEIAHRKVARAGERLSGKVISTAEDRLLFVAAVAAWRRRAFIQSCQIWIPEPGRK